MVAAFGPFEIAGVSPAANPSTLLLERLNPFQSDPQTNLPLETSMSKLYGKSVQEGTPMHTLYTAISSLGKPQTFYPVLADAIGLKECVFLCQLIYWSPRSHDKERWIYKSAAEFFEETSLDYVNQRRVRIELVRIGVLEERYEREQHKMYFRVNIGRFNEVVEDHLAKCKVVEMVEQSEDQVADCKVADDDLQGGTLQKARSIINTENTTTSTAATPQGVDPQGRR